jgi:hypothetical protein
LREGSCRFVARSALEPVLLHLAPQCSAAHAHQASLPAASIRHRWQPLLPRRPGLQVKDVITAMDFFEKAEGAQTIFN